LWSNSSYGSLRSVSEKLTCWLLWNGVFLVALWVVLFTPTHPYSSGLISLAFVILGTFFLTVAHVRPEREVLKYKIWFWRRAIPYHEILECDESWVFGYVKCRSYLFPWGKLYFVRGYADDTLFGWDRKIDCLYTGQGGVSLKRARNLERAMANRPWGGLRLRSPSHNPTLSNISNNWNGERSVTPSASET